MANGEFVFFNVQVMQDDNYARTSWFTHENNDTVREINLNSANQICCPNPTSSGRSHVLIFFQALNALRSFIFIAYKPAGDELKQLNREIAARTLRSYNFTYKAGVEVRIVQSHYIEKLGKLYL